MTERIEESEEGLPVERTDEGNGTWQDPGKFEEFHEKSESSEICDELIAESDKRADPELARERAIAGLVELRDAEVPEDKFKIPAECFDELIEKIRKSDLAGSAADYPERSLRRMEKMYKSVDKDVGEKLWALYSDPEISVGIHGAVAKADSGFGTEESPFFADGLGCGYRDLRRTVAFQDRRYHGHGFIPFPDLLDYSYPSLLRRKDDPLVIRKEVLREEVKHHDDGRVTRNYTREWVSIPARQYGVVVAIPRSFESTDPDLRGKEIETPDNSPFNRGGTKTGAALKPEFIVGVISDSDPNTMVWNPNFDVEHLRELSRQHEVQKQAEEEERKRLAELEAAKRENNPDHSRSTGLIGKLLNKLKRRGK